MTVLRRVDYLWVLGWLWRPIHDPHTLVQFGQGTVEVVVGGRAFFCLFFPFPFNFLVPLSQTDSVNAVLLNLDILAGTLCDNLEYHSHTHIQTYTNTSRHTHTVTLPQNEKKSIYELGVGGKIDSCTYRSF